MQHDVEVIRKKLEYSPWLAPLHSLVLALQRDGDEDGRQEPQWKGKKLREWSRSLLTIWKGGATKDLLEYCFSLLYPPLKRCQGPSCNQEKIRVVVVLNNALLLKYLK